MVEARSQFTIMNTVSTLTLVTFWQHFLTAFAY